jgi:hypothetical protein
MSETPSTPDFEKDEIEMKKLDEIFVGIMLQIEQRYHTLDKFQKSLVEHWSKILC